MAARHVECCDAKEDFAPRCNAVYVSGHYEDMDRRSRFEALYCRHAPFVKAYVLRRADASVADDVVSDVFLVCWRRLGEAPPDALPWLLAIAKRVLSTQRRGDRRRAALRQRLTDNGGQSDQPHIGTGALRSALASLSDADRELLLLIAWDGLSPTQAAAALGIKSPTLRVRLLRARRRLAHALVIAQSSAVGVRSVPQPSENPQ